MTQAEIQELKELLEKTIRRVYGELHNIHPKEPHKVWHKVIEEKPKTERIVLCVTKTKHFGETRLFYNFNLQEIEYYDTWAYLDDLVKII